MSSWIDLTEEQLRGLSTQRLYNIYKMLQVSRGYDSWCEDACGDDPDDELSAKCRIIKAELDTREHLEREKIPANTGVSDRSKDRSPWRWRLWKDQQPKCREREGPIKNAGECIGVQVFKRSGKPFKSRNKYNTVKGVTINEHTGREAFTFEEDTSIVDVWICKVRDK